MNRQWIIDARRRRLHAMREIASEIAFILAHAKHPDNRHNFVKGFTRGEKFTSEKIMDQTATRVRFYPRSHCWIEVSDLRPLSVYGIEVKPPTRLSTETQRVDVDTIDNKSAKPIKRKIEFGSESETSERHLVGLSSSISLSQTVSYGSAAVGASGKTTFTIQLTATLERETTDRVASSKSTTSEYEAQPGKRTSLTASKETGIFKQQILIDCLSDVTVKIWMHNAIDNFTLQSMDDIFASIAGVTKADHWLLNGLRGFDTRLEYPRISLLVERQVQNAMFNDLTITEQDI
ncbi:MAG: hypothetical protein GDA50_04265 [Alphaproteobacteria bacterium GM202ARS2]|nr:hypothetical protein [Alphaproteobacteria bacterium GM202ARS2]